MNIDILSNKFIQDGIVKIENFINDEELNLLRQFVDNKYKENNYNYFFLAGNQFEESFVDRGNTLKRIEKLIFELCKNLSIKTDGQHTYKVLRVIDGKKSEQEAHNYHFDAHLITILLPIYIPKELNGNNGDLVISPNFRNNTGSIIKNIFQKIFYQRFLSKLFFKKEYFRNKFNFKQLQLKEGNIYLFNGFRSLHGNLGIDVSNKRATLLIHYHDMFKESKLVQLNRKLRQFKERKIIEKNKK